MKTPAQIQKQIDALNKKAIAVREQTQPNETKADILQRQKTVKGLLADIETLRTKK